MSRPFFSIIIPTFNSEKTIEKCILSILNQTFKDYEILVIDASSTDRTLNLINLLSKKYFSKILVTSENDNGIYDAMNKGILIAKGNWLYFLGSDDELYSNCVLENVRKRIKYFDSVVYGNVKIVGNISWALDNQIYDGTFNTKKFKNKNICHQSIFYKRSVIINNQILYNLKYKICSDWEFNMRLWKFNYFKYINLTIANFMAGGASSKNTVDEDFAINLPTIIKQNFDKKITKFYFVIINKIKNYL
jgi:glycosyltransferase involved in cell wall biosynthesis